MRSKIHSIIGSLVAMGLSAPVIAQQQAAVTRIVAAPSTITIESGQTVPLTVTAFDAAGNRLDVPFRMAAPRRAIDLGFAEDRDNTSRRTVTGAIAGNYEIVITAVAAGSAPVELTVPVTVTWPAVSRIEIRGESGTLYEGATLRHAAVAYHADGSARPEPRLRWTSSSPEVASVDRFGLVTGHRTGSVTITAEMDRARETVRYQVRPFPATSLEIESDVSDGRTGDVFPFTAVVRGADGNRVEDLPVNWAFTLIPDDSINAPGAAAQIIDGRFVAEVPGRYTVHAMAGPLAARAAVDVRPRDVIREVEFQGRGAVRDVRSSDLWIFEAANGRDYAVTGTWGAEGKAYFWDVTNPANIVKTDSIQVDARTVNDVKVAPNGRYAALSREGASNRRNGVVIMDLSDPAHPTIASTFDEGLTGGVHNMFATNDYLFALSGGDKYVILDVRDLYNPKYVSEYNHPESRIHDVWVHNGIAYSSEWGNGVVVVDVGNGRWGGSIENPVFVTNVPYPVGRTHAAFPYFQESTGKMYLFLGDEIMNRQGHAWVGTSGRPQYDPTTGGGGIPGTTSGYVHIIDFTDPENPQDVARYHVPEFGTHNIWVEDDVLYQAYYEGGLRVVDVSGELMGNLADQGREMAVFKPYDPMGYIANAPMTWGAQPHKGFIFFSDWNSGLWSVRLKPEERPTS